ncbi:MAG: hypothetical protein V2B15_08640 [Bacteroidota bacterium]
MYCHRKMVEIDAEIDQAPTKKMIKDLAELRNRNLLAFAELSHFNDHGTFKYEHPLIVEFSLRSELITLKKKDPGEFLNKFADARDNVKRYKSFLNNKSRIEQKKALDRENLKKYEARVAVFKEVLQEE